MAMFIRKEVEHQERLEAAGYRSPTWRVLRAQMKKYGYRKTAPCMLCQKAREECGGSWNGELPNETIGHIQSAGCLGQKEVVTAAHNACIRELLQEVNVHGKADRHLKLLTIETESRLGTLWDPEECYQYCSREEL
jgi:hypothetical protein